MNRCPVDIARLSLLCQRILDAEVLTETDGTALLGAAEAAGRALEAGDAEAARRHVEEVARCTEAFVRAGALAPAEGGAVLETTRRLLDGS